MPGRKEEEGEMRYEDDGGLRRCLVRYRGGRRMRLREEDEAHEDYDEDDEVDDADAGDDGDDVLAAAAAVDADEEADVNDEAYDESEEEG